MALTTYLISQASDHLGEKQIQLWLTLFRKLQRYKEFAFIYAPQMEQRLTDAEGTVKARMLNALMTQIDDLGTGEVSIRGDREGTYWSQPDERMALIDEGLDVLFEDVSTMITVPPSSSSGQVFGSSGYTTAAGNRHPVVCCPVCSVAYWYVHETRYCSCI
jgi:hypothetical protein